MYLIPMNMFKKQAKSNVFEYFSLTEDTKYFICQCSVDASDDKKFCESKISAYSGANKNAPTRASNLKRHLQRFHPKIYEKVNKIDKVSSVASHSSVSTSTSTDNQTSLTKFIITNKITITMTAEIFRQSIIDLVVQNSMPLSMFSQPAFLKLNAEMARKYGISLERHNIRTLIINEVIAKKDELKKDLAGWYIFLKMDAATRHRVNYFGINVRYCNAEGKIVTKTLAVKDTKANHDSHYLHNLVENVLSDYNINKSQIICIVTDNASNMIKTIEKLNETEETNEEEDIGAVEEKEDKQPDYLTSLDEGLDDVVEEASKLSQIKHMRCAVHTLQLAIRDGLKDPHATNLIGKLRQVAIGARTQKIDSILRRRAGKGAILDQVTRWGSTYLMVKRLIELRSVLEDIDNPSISLSDIQWQQAIELEQLLLHPYIATKLLQAEDLTAGQFLHQWKKLQFDLNKKGGLIAKGILNSMDKREPQLMDNDILLASVYVDPSNRLLLDESQVPIARECLCNLAMKMMGILEKSPEKSELNIESDGNGQSSSSDSETFENYLKRMKEKKVKKMRLDAAVPVDVKLAKFKAEFNKALEDLEKYDSESTSSLEEVIQSYPEIIRKVATTVLALPPTQVSVERLFSVLKLIKSDLRASIKEDITEAILFLRTCN